MKPSSSSPRSLSLPCCSSSLGAGSVTWRTKAPSTARPRTTEPRTAGPGSLTWRRDLFGSRPRAGQLGHALQQTVGVDGFAASRVNLEVGVDRTGGGMGKSESVRVNLGGRSYHKKKNELNRE